MGAAGCRLCVLPAAGAAIGSGKEIRTCVTELYDLEKTKKIGQGSYGCLYRGRNKATGSVGAVKIVSKAQEENVAVCAREVAIAKRMDHPNIAKLFEVLEDGSNIYVVSEYCPGGALFDRILESGHLGEVQAAIVMQQIARAVFYMHENMVCCRCLKPEHMMFAAKGAIENNTLKLIDFGLAREFRTSEVMTTKAGSPHYVAPQLLHGKYDHRCDLWSCGVIMYVMLCGYPPFFGETDAEVISKVGSGKFSFDEADWDSVSWDAKNLIRMLLKADPDERYTAEQALNHRWIKDNTPRAAGTAIQSGLIERLRCFGSCSKLKKAALHVIAQQLNGEQAGLNRSTFAALDPIGAGLLTLEGMRSALLSAGLPEIPQDLPEVFEEIDTNGNGVIEYTEFLAATLDERVYLQEGVCRSAFCLLDRDGDGRLSQEELGVAFGGGGGAEGSAATGVVEDIMREAVGNADGSIDFEEFMAMMRGQGGFAIQSTESCFM